MSTLLSKGDPMVTTAESSTPEALIAALYAVEGKAEIVDGRIVCMSPANRRHGRISYRICRSLEQVEERLAGCAYPDNVGFLVDLPHRTSFSPDAAFCIGPPPADDDLDFAQGAPDFAVEVRSKNDYGPSAERQMAAKRADYFAAGTKVVWDIDLLSEDVVRVYRATEPENPTVYRRGQTAEAEPAVPGWLMPVEELFA
ncbi:MAG: Uma2 family endonuclease [Lacipirellulaceae bacterium]